MSRDATVQRQRKKIEPLWRAIFSGGEVSGYDFTTLSKSNPPPIDAEPIILDFPVNRISAVMMRMRE